MQDLEGFRCSGARFPTNPRTCAPRIYPSRILRATLVNELLSLFILARVIETCKTKVDPILPQDSLLLNRCGSINM
jgi:hypothetical protein